MTYDASGNVTNDCNYSYTWDVYGNPVGGNGLIYDAMNRLVEISPGEQILYSPIGKLGLMNGQSVDDLWFPLPGGSSEELLGPYGANRHTLHSDWLGNVRLATTYSDRSLAYDVAYSPYGENYVPEGGSSSDVYFTGQRQQIAGGLFDFPYREYSIVGRWISPDPAGLNAVDITNPQSWNRYAYALNNPLRYTDPLGLFCFYGGAGDTPDNDSDPTDYDFGASGPDDCGNASQWINTSATVTVNGDGSDGPTFEDGQQIFPEVVPLQPTFGNCVKSGTDYFSLQHGLQAASGGTLGNSWVSSAFLGSSVSSAITLGQYGMNFIAPSSNSPSGGQTFSSTAGEVLSDAAAPAASKLAPSVPNVAFTVAASAGVAVQTPTSSAALNLSGSLSGTVPLNAAATTGAKALSLLGTVKLPFDLAVGGFSALVCSIGR